MNAAIIFGILLVLMLTGMPISISLGLYGAGAVHHDRGAPRVVALKLFTGIEKFEIMAIPFILAGNFLTHGGWRKRMINFLPPMVGHWYGGLGPAGCWPARCSLRCRAPAGHGGGDRLDPAAGDGAGGFPNRSARASSPPPARWAS